MMAVLGACMVRLHPVPAVLRMCPLTLWPWHLAACAPCSLPSVQDAMRESVQWFVENYNKPGVVRGVQGYVGDAPKH